MELDERRDQETTKVSQGAPILPSFLGWFSTTSESTIKRLAAKSENASQN